MRVCGIIAEYDPLHAGHAWHLQQARQLSAADYVVCVLSAAFSQRGMPHLFSTWDRAQMALESGADLVIAMPFSFGCAQANRFARGGVGILASLGVVTHLSFGAEDGDLNRLLRTADAIQALDSGVDARLHSALSEGLPLAAARARALAARYKESELSPLDQPNNILALCYLQALAQLHSNMQPLVVQRSGSYHSTALQPLPSAGAVRAALLRGDWQGLNASVPSASREVIDRAVSGGLLHRPGALDQVLLHHLLTMEEQALAETAEISEGLEHRILQSVRNARSREDLLQLCKTRRYPYTRLSRALSHALLGQKAQTLPEQPAYARLIGMRRSAAPLLRAIKRSGYPLISRSARHGGEDLCRDMRAEELWVLGAGQPVECVWRQAAVILE
ncbi:MAG: nucleotidyltransferase family protein [Clostridiales bacterium]|nr:nucleotidyltransferase family protein [Clostridiales bacterium]